MTINDVLNQLQIATSANFMGLAYPSTVPPTPATGIKVFYIAAQSGTYTSFNNITVASNDGLVLLVYNAGWVKSNAQIDQSFYSALNTYITETNGADFSVAGFISDAGALITGSPAAGRNCTDFIRISLTKNIVFFAESNNQYVNALSYYDVNKVYISGVRNNQSTIAAQTVLAANIPTNAVYIRSSTTDALLASSFVKYGGIQAPLQSIEALLLSKTSQSSIETKYGKVPKRIGKNLFDYTVAPCNRYPLINEPSGGDGVHPSIGMLQIADCIYSVASHLI